MECRVASSLLWSITVCLAILKCPAQGQDSGLVMCYNSSTCDLAEEFSNPMTIEDCCSNGVTFQINETCQQCTACSKEQSIYFLIDATSNFELNNFCRTVTLIQLLVAAFNHSVSGPTKTYGYLFPDGDDIWNSSCTCTSTVEEKLTSLTQELRDRRSASTVFPGIFGDSTLAVPGLNVIKNVASTTTTPQAVLIITDGNIQDSDSDVETAVTNLQAAGVSTIISAGLGLIDKNNLERFVLPAGRSDNAVVNNNIVDLGTSIVKRLEESGILCSSHANSIRNLLVGLTTAIDDLYCACIPNESCFGSFNLRYAYPICGGPFQVGYGVVVVSVERTSITVSEGDNVEVCIQLSAGITEQVIVTAMTRPKSGAANPATAGSDYITSTVMFTFRPSQTPALCGNVPIIDDSIGLEPNELFSVRITSVSGANVMIGDQDESCVEIIDNDVPEVKWEEDNVTIPEGGNRTVCFTSDIGTAAPYTVVLAASPKVDNRCATAGVDYTVDSTLSFNVPVMASGGRYCIDLSTVDDSIAEGTEQFQLTFDSTGSANEGNPHTLCVDIEDNDDGQDGELVMCYNSTTCAAAAEFANLITAEDCCLNNPDGLSFRRFCGSEMCRSCIVYGFFNDSVTQPEQGQGYMIRVGYMKGAASGDNLIFDVEDTPGTAREGSGFDYTVNTNFIRVIASAPDRIENVVYILRTDSIAQEINETFTLELVHRAGTNIPTGDGVFFRNTVEVTIIDNDDVQIIFTEDDFRVNESNMTGPVSFMPVKVSKNSRIANPIVLDIIPLAVMDATNPPGLPNNVPSNNPFSPPFADTNDFDTATIRITFEPDEDEDDSERDAPIPITNDDVNEAEQVFVVHLILINSSIPGSIDLTARSTSLCRIINDDSISIGFELPSYTYSESNVTEIIDSSFMSPKFNGSTAYGPVYLVKENGVRTEQIFGIVIGVTDGAPDVGETEINEDYSIGLGTETSVVIMFPLNKQRLNFEITIFPDIIPEGTEGFMASSSREDEAQDETGTIFTLPEYSTATATTTIYILDDDPIIIGFENIAYTVDESIGMLEVYVRVISPPEDMILAASPRLSIQTTAVNATGNIDYRELNAEAFDVVLPFDDFNRRRSFMVQIIDNAVFENVKVFDLELRSFPGGPPSGVTLDPGIATVYIQDNDYATIGFINAPYSVGENEGEVDIQVGVIEGFLLREVVVLFSTLDSSAIDGADYTAIQDMLLTFSLDIAVITITVSIANDDVYELTETFNATLSFDGDPIPRVILSPATAVTTIVDDDELVFGFDPTEYSIDEGDGNISLSISLSGDAGVFVPHLILCTQDGTAISAKSISSGDEPPDYTAISKVAGSVSFSNVNKRDVLVTITSDSIIEFDETFSAILLSAFLATVDGGQAIPLSNQELSRLILSPDVANITILDDDNFVVGFANEVYSMSEDEGDITLTINVNDGQSQCNESELVLNFSVVMEGGRQFTDDFVVNVSDSITVTDVSQSIVFSIINDDLLEIDETFTAEISLARMEDKNCLILRPSTAEITILDDDEVVVDFLPRGYSFTEGVDGNVSLNLSVISGRIGREVVVSLHTCEEDSAARGSDFNVVIQSVTFNETVQSIDIPVEIIDDNIFENIFETFTLCLSTDVPRVILMNNKTVVTIRDNDNVAIGFDSTSYTVNESEGTVLIRLEVDLQENVIFENTSIQVVLATTAGSATSRDYETILSAVLNFTNTSTDQNVSLTIIDDQLLESDEEEFMVTLKRADQNDDRVILEPDLATVTILDNDTAVIGFMNESYVVVEGDGSVDVTVGVQVGGLGREVVVTLSTQVGTTKDGEDFEVISDLQLTLNSTKSSTVVSINITSDEHFEEDEKFVVRLSARVIRLQLNTGSTVNLSSAICQNGGKSDVFSLSNDTLERRENISIYLDDILLSQENGVLSLILSDNENDRVSVGPSETTVTIIDDDSIVIGFSNNTYYVNECDGGVIVSVTANGSLQTEVVVFLSTIENGDSVDAFYERVANRSLTFNSSHTLFRETISITVVLNDTMPLIHQEFELSLSLGEPDPRVVLEPETATVKIFEVHGEVGFNSSHPMVMEGIGQVNIPVVLLSGDICGHVEFAFSINDLNAIAGEDYNATDSLRVVALSTQHPYDVITIDIIDDNVTECTESFSVHLHFLSGQVIDRVDLMPSSMTITIMDDDKSVVGFLNHESNITESSDPALRILNITFGLISGQLCDPVVVYYYVVDANSTAGRDDDFFLNTGSITFTSSFQNHTIVFNLLDDDIPESPEQVLLELSLSEQESVQESERIILTPPEAVISIFDDDEQASTPVMSSDSASSNTLALVLGVIGSLVFVVTVVMIIIAIVLLVFVKRRKQRKIDEDNRESEDLLMSFSVQSSYRLNISPRLLIASSSIRMTETIGQGEFGVVFKGHIVISEVVSEVVAIKTLKGIYDRTAIRDMLKECSKMEKFHHPNVLTLRGVCLDGGPSPFIIMPFMSNGSLHDYLRKNREALVISEESKGEDKERVAGKRLIDMCLQVAMGMEYLAKQKLVHRDLAARNCMIDSSYVIKVADFGLSESVGTKDYFRQDKLAVVRLPLKWLAPESLEDFIFSEKSDVWAYGVTCWEIFTAGKVPYASIHLSDLLRSIVHGQRLDKPTNAACSDEMYALMLRCWELEPEGRPTFSDIVISLSESLETMADYLDISAFCHERAPQSVDNSDTGIKAQPKQEETFVEGQVPQEGSGECQEDVEDTNDNMETVL